MNLDALGPCYKSEHIVSEDRIAAFGHAVVDAFYVFGINYKDVVGAFLLDDIPDLLFRFVDCRLDTLADYSSAKS